jgi:two-component system phosphate regulon sensor histidine kinase PhoR
LGRKPEHLILAGPFGRQVGEAGNSHAMRKASFDPLLVKHILNRHGGRLTVESVPGQGATFIAHLPMAVPASAESPRSAARI